jgi:organic hydroperoxide reductase OsmC/OhrA
MSEYQTVVVWSRDGAVFTDSRYSRRHHWVFDGGVEVPASASPHVVPLPLSVAAAVDPEEAFVASLSSCHMLVFLSLAAKRGFVVDSYRDEAVGVLARNASGKLAMTTVTLRPEVQFTGDKQPSADELLQMHDESHDQCFIASSVTTDVRCEPSAANLAASGNRGSHGESTAAAPRP